MIYLGTFSSYSRTLRSLLTPNNRRALQEQVDRREEKGLHHPTPTSDSQPESDVSRIATLPLASPHPQAQ